MRNPQLRTRTTKIVPSSFHMGHYEPYTRHTRSCAMLEPRTSTTRLSTSSPDQSLAEPAFRTRIIRRIRWAKKDAGVRGRGERDPEGVLERGAESMTLPP